MATTHRDQLNKLCTHLASGTPLTSEDLAAPGIPAGLAVHYVRAGWLERLAHGVYRRPNDPPALHPSVALLQRTFEGLHVDGKSALDWHGIRHFVSQRPILHLYGWKAGGLPGWFTRRFPAGVRQPLQEARELVERSYSLCARRAARPAQAMRQRRDRSPLPAARPRALPAVVW
jgi:Transcriptional regulator, AbiEi antitoxin N-terminal domain